MKQLKNDSLPSIRVTTEEKEQILQNAFLCHLNLSTYIRKIALQPDLSLKVRNDYDNDIKDLIIGLSDLVNNFHNYTDTTNMDEKLSEIRNGVISLCQYLK